MPHSVGGHVPQPTSVNFTTVILGCVTAQPTSVILGCVTTSVVPLTPLPPGRGQEEGSRAGRGCVARGGEERGGDAGGGGGGQRGGGGGRAGGAG